LDQSSIHIVKCSSRQFEEIVHDKDAKERSSLTASRLRADFKMRDVAGLSAHYSSSTSLESAVSSESHLYVARKLTAVARVVSLGPRLSAEMLNQINRLPRWSTETEADYHNFFASHGTHVVLRAALGGILRIVARGDMTVDEEIVKKALGADADISILANMGIDIGVGVRHEKGSDSKKSSGKAQITVFRDGGGAVASQLSGALEKLFSHLQNPSSLSQPSDWTDVRMRWIDALETDSVFCPDDRETDFEWLYNCEGLTADQQRDLKLASKSYLQAPVEKEDPNPTPTSATPAPTRRFFLEKIFMPRDQNLKEVDKTLEHARNRWKSKFGHWIKFWNR
jgi:hypothetical protein